MTTSTEIAKTPTTLHRCTGDYADLACSERDPYNPVLNPVLWVSLAGGAVTADIKRTGIDSAADGDEWIYDQATGIFMTAEQVADALVD